MSQMIPTKVSGIVDQPGGKKKKKHGGWRIIAQLVSL